MKLETLHATAHKLMQEHGLHDWKFTTDKAVRRFGVCRHRTKTISMSEVIVKLNNEAEVIDTLLHEIAHALAGANVGHGIGWVLRARALGAKTERCYGEGVITPPKKWLGTCPTCRKTIHRHRRKNIACASCCRGRFDTAHKFVWTHI